MHYWTDSPCTAALLYVRHASRESMVGLVIDSLVLIVREDCFATVLSTRVHILNWQPMSVAVSFYINSTWAVLPVPATASHQSICHKYQSVSSVTSASPATLKVCAINWIILRNSIEPLAITYRIPHPVFHLWSSTSTYLMSIEIIYVHV